MEWLELYEMAKNKVNPRMVSPFIEAGGVAAVILTKDNNIYSGVCIDTACSLGMCAERNAIANMITNGENEILKIVCVMGEGKIAMPCGACREYIMQLHKDSRNIEMLVSIEPLEVVTIGELVPSWWGSERFN